MAENVNAQQTDQSAQAVQQPEKLQGVETTQSNTQEAARPKITGRGKVEAFSLDTPASESATPATQTVATAVANNPENNTPNTEGQSAPSSQDGATLSDEAILAALKGRNIDLTSLDALRNFSQQQQQPQNTASAEETPEQKAAKEKAADQRLLSRFLQNNWSAEDYVSAKAIASMKLEDLSKSDLQADLRSQGMSDQQISDIIRDTYYQVDDADLDTLDEDEKKAAILRKTWGAEQLKNYSVQRQQQAKQLLDIAKKQLDEQELLEKQEGQYSAKVAEYLKTYPRKQTFPLGKINGQEALPVEYELTDLEIQEATKPLRDVAEREKFFFTEEGNLHHENITNLLVRNSVLEKALRLAYQHGGTKQAEIFQSVFPNSDPLSLGTGAAPAPKTNDGRPAKIIRKGAVEATEPQQRRKLNGIRNY